MSIVFIYDGFTFPDGDAAANRVHSYSKGFIENGFNVHVICFANQYDAPDDGIINGVKYYYAFGKRKRSKFFIVRTSQKILKFFKTLSLLRRINKKDKVAVIVVYTTIFGTHIYSWMLSRITGTRIIKEISEHPMKPYFNSGAFLTKIGLLKLRTELYFTDGILCISKFLVEYFKSHGFDSRRLLIVPSTVDPSRFNHDGLPSPCPYRYIGYFGGLTFERDNINLLVEAFAAIADKFPDMRLVLGGFSKPEEKKQLENLISDLGIGPRVVLLKYLPREEITRYIKHSDILVMVRGTDLKAQASFPSKIIEYLATAKPVITVNVGEIRDYLSDGVNAFIVEPGNSRAIAEKIESVLAGYEKALEVGHTGKELTHTIFHYNYQAGRILRFIETL
ncbi:MAG: glycosyltransferase family 4 protein [Chloroflexota bacterium]